MDVDLAVVRVKTQSVRIVGDGPLIVALEAICIASVHENVCRGDFRSPQNGREVSDGSVVLTAVKATQAMLDTSRMVDRSRERSRQILFQEPSHLVHPLSL